MRPRTLYFNGVRKPELDHVTEAERIVRFMRDQNKRAKQMRDHTKKRREAKARITLPKLKFMEGDGP